MKTVYVDEDGRLANLDGYERLGVSNTVGALLDIWVDLDDGGPLGVVIADLLRKEPQSTARDRLITWITDIKASDAPPGDYAVVTSAFFTVGERIRITPDNTVFRYDYSDKAGWIKDSALTLRPIVLDSETVPEGEYTVVKDTQAIVIGAVRKLEGNRLYSYADGLTYCAHSGITLRSTPVFKAEDAPAGDYYAIHTKRKIRLPGNVPPDALVRAA